MHRTFNTIEEAIKTWSKEAEEAFRKRGFSGILCECECYRRKDKIKGTSPISRCTLLLPEKIYNDYLKYTSEKYKDCFYEFPYIAVLSPGSIRVRFYDDGKHDGTTKADLCNNNFRVKELLGRYLGKKIRLGKNILVKNPSTQKNQI